MPSLIFTFPTGIAGEIIPSIPEVQTIDPSLTSFIFGKNSKSAEELFPLPDKIAFIPPGSITTGIQLFKSDASKIRDVNKFTFIIFPTK